MPLFETEESKARARATAEAFADPQVGDRFHEMYSYWFYVVEREGDLVTILEASPPCTFPLDAKCWTGSVRELQERFSYKGLPGYSVDLENRGSKVDGWLAAWLTRDLGEASE